MRVIVTGAAGFIGTHLTDRLLALGHHVHAIDPRLSGEWLQAHHVIRPFLCWTVFNAFIPSLSLPPVDVIYHLGGVSRIQPSLVDPTGTYHANSTDTLVALDIAKHHKARLVLASSSVVKGDVNSSPYAYTKHLAESHCAWHTQCFGVSTVSARIHNVYGPGDRDGVVAVFDRARQEKKSLPVTGDGKQRRDFIHVDDVVNALIRLAGSDTTGAVDVGFGVTWSISQVAGMFGCDVEYVATRCGEEDVGAADTSTLLSLGWKPTTHLADYIGSLPKP